MDESEKTPEQLLAEAVERLTAAATTGPETYAEVGSADLARLVTHPKVSRTDLGKALLGPVGAQIRKAEASGEEPKPTLLHREKHLRPLLKALADA